MRPKIRDIGWHRLHANVAALVDWLRTCYREGGSATPGATTRTDEFKDRGTSISFKLAKMRVRMGIMGAYGWKTEKFGVRKRTPPSRRDRGAPAA